MWYRNMERLKKKYEGAKKYVPAPITHKVKGASVGIIGFGSTEAAILEAQHQLNTPARHPSRFHARARGAVYQ